MFQEVFYFYTGKVPINIQIYFHQYLPFSESLLFDNYKDLCDIAAAIEQKDPASARRIAENHVTRFNDLMEKKLNE